MNRTPVSAVIITLNEESRIRRTLDSISWCDEIVVVDSLSTDRTVEICRQYGAKVFPRQFTGYGEQKRFAVEKATHNWVLNIDADEVISDELGQEIRLFPGNTPVAYTGMELRISFVFMGRKLRSGGGQRQFHLRMFDRRLGNFNTSSVHEKVVTSGPTGRFKSEALHYSYTDLSHYLRKFDKYTSASAEAMRREGRRTSLLQCMAHVLPAFLKLYFLKGLFLDGLPGFTWSLLSTTYVAVKYAKLHELQSGDTRSPDLQGPGNALDSEQTRM